MLRLNNDQAFNLIDGLVELRSKIKESDLERYDSDLHDILDQLRQFGLIFDIHPEQEVAVSEEDGTAQAREMLYEIRGIADRIKNNRIYELAQELLEMTGEEN